jgi:MFS family permease
LADPADARFAAGAQRDYVAENEPHNFLVLAAHQVAVRVAWIFKTESIIVPAFLDMVGGTAWMRGLLPVLNRFGHSIPPVLHARRLKLAPQKKWSLAVCTLGMGLSMLLVAAAWWLWPVAAGDSHGVRRWWPWFFLAAYAVFFVMTGLNQLAANTLTGKLIRADRRGRLMSAGVITGAPLAILAALVLLPAWLDETTARFDLIFGTCGVLMLLAALSAIWLREPHDAYADEETGLISRFREATVLLRRDARFRRLCVVAALFGVVMMLFPHYQAVGRKVLRLDMTHLLYWVVIQNAGTMVCSLLAGPLADRCGNRLALRWTLAGSTLPPVLAIVLGNLPSEAAGPWFWTVFPLVGLTPVAGKLLVNYSLELAEPVHQPAYVSTLGLCIAMPVILGAGLVGWLIGEIGFDAVLAGGAFLIGLSAVLTFFLAEPRHAG